MTKAKRRLEIGTEPWLEVTGGRLTAVQALGLATAGFGQTLRDMFIIRKPLSIEESKRQSERVSIARKEVAKVLETHRERVLDRQGEAVMNHTARTYLFGAALVSDEIFSRIDHTIASVASTSSVKLARAAVISHFQPNLPSQSGAEAQMIALGASADVMGIGLKKIDPELLRDIWVEWPDLGFIQEVRVLLKGERTRAPRTRPGVLAISGMPYLLRSSK